MKGPQTVHPYTISVSEDSGSELNLHKISCENACNKDERCTCTDMTGEVVKKVQQTSYCCTAERKDSVVDEEVCVDEIFHLKSSHEQLAGHDPSSEVKVYNSEDVSVSKEFVISDVRQNKCLIKSLTFPSSEVESFNLFCPEINGESPSTTAPIQTSFADKLSMYVRSSSFPASSKLVSALKGGRAQHGTSPSMDMHVKWAEDVYDPPATSMSHTVKSYILQRPKSKRKDDHKKKHKGKNSRANKKISLNRANVGILSAPFPVKLQSGGANGSAARSEDILEFAVGGAHDVKCGSILLRESLAKVHLSFGEAT